MRTSGDRNMDTSNRDASPANRVIVRYRLRFLDRRAPAWVGVIGVASILAIWQMASSFGFVSEADLPGPASIFQAAVSMVQNGSLLVNVEASLIRIVAGYFIGAISGILIGLWFGFSRITERVGMPIANALYPIPKLAIIPLLILWIGAGEMPKILVVAAEVFFPVLFNTYSGVRNTDPLLIRAAASFGAQPLTLIRQVILPASLPTIFAGLRIGAGLSLLVLVAAEMIGAQHGIGAMILTYSSLMQTPNLMVGVILLSILGLAITRGLGQIERWLLPWKE